MNYTTMTMSTTVSQKEKLTALAKKIKVNRSWLLRELIGLALKSADPKELRAKADKAGDSNPHGAFS